MSFSELTSSPQQKSHEGLLREARKRYFARYMSRSDKELDNDYAELLRIMNILRFKVTKALQGKLTESLTKRRRGASVNPIKEIERETQIVERQRQNSLKRMAAQEIRLKKAKKRLVKVRSPHYRLQLEGKLQKASGDIAQLRQEIGQGKKKLEKTGSALLEEEMFLQGEAYSKLARELELQKQKLQQQLRKNEQLQKQVDSLKKADAKTPTAKSTILRPKSPNGTAQQEVGQLPKMPRPSSRPKTQSSQLKLNQLGQLQRKIGSLDERLRLVEDHLGRAQILKIELEQLTAKTLPGRTSNFRR